MASNGAGLKLGITVNLDKSSYVVGDPVKVLAYTAYQGCNNTAFNVIMEGQISTMMNHYTIMNQYVNGGSGIYGSKTFTPPFQAPDVAGNYVMNIKFYLKRNGYFILGNATPSTTTPTPFATFDLPYTVIPNCSIPPSGYVKCSNEGGVCTDFVGTTKVAYGCGSSFNYRDNVAGSISCDSNTFGGDPVPGIVKSCFFLPTVPVPTVTVSATNDSTGQKIASAGNVTANLSVASNTPVTISWKTTGATHCYCTYAGTKGDCGEGVGDEVTGRSNLTLAQSKTFTVNCDDNPPPTNGVCSATHYACNSGTSVNWGDNASNWSWNCNGNYGGTNASCSENKPPAMNGSCFTTHYSCKAGTSVSQSDNVLDWSWSCSGSNGGTTASCSEKKPITGTCNSNFTDDTICYTINNQFTCEKRSQCFWLSNAL